MKPKPTQYKTLDFPGTHRLKYVAQSTQSCDQFKPRKGLSEVCPEQLNWTPKKFQFLTNLKKTNNKTKQNKHKTKQKKGQKQEQEQNKKKTPKHPKKQTKNQNQTKPNTNTNKTRSNYFSITLKLISIFLYF